jgi:hypothetical protein
MKCLQMPANMGIEPLGEMLDARSTALRTLPAESHKPLVDYLLRPDVLVRVVLYLTFLAYLPTVFFDFAYDDLALILLNPWMASWKSVVMFFTRSFWAFADFPRPTDYYRPLVMTLLAMIRHIAGPAPGWFHLVVIGVHVLAVYLVYRVARALTGDGTLAAIAAAIFGLHPTKIESVAWISGVSDSLCLVFFLGCILVYLRWKNNGGRGQVPRSSLLLLLLAMLSKEMAVAVPVLIALYEILTNEVPIADRVRSALRVVTPYAIVVVAVLLMRVYAMRDLVGMPGYNFHYLYSFYTAPQALVWYLSKQVWPLPISVQYPFLLVTQPSLLRFLVPLAAVLVSAIALACLLRKSTVGCFLAAWFLLTLLPVLAFCAVLQLHDRHMYAPSVATSIAFAYLIVTFVRRCTGSGFPLRSVVVALVCVVLTALTVHQVRYWSDDITLFNRAIAVAYDHSDAYGALADAYFSVQDVDNAERVGKLWIQNTLDPKGGWETLAEVRRQRKDYAGARDALLRALRCTKTPFGRVGPATALGWLAQAEGNSAEAVYWYGLAAAGQPSVAMLHDMYGRVLLQAGKTAEGQHELQIALRLRRYKAL